MRSKFIFFIIFIASIFINAQNEFITIWKPSNISDNIAPGGILSSDNQIYFPGIGTNFNVSWEEVNYPSHNGTLSNVTSTSNFLIDFGTPLNPAAADATYKVKISNGNGTFNRIKFKEGAVNYGDSKKITDISQWGNIVWQNMNYAFSTCDMMDMSATDSPDLSVATSLRYMFNGCTVFTGNTSINNWNISNITDIGWMFHITPQFNQPLNNWNTSNVTKMDHVFHFCLSFNQPLDNWDTSNVTDMNIMFAGCSTFNQNIGNWNVQNLQMANLMLANTSSFNQNLENWKLNNLQTASNFLLGTALNCENYNKTLIGWSNNTNIASNVNIGSTSPLVYSSQAALNARAFLINTKGWTINSDNYDPTCREELEIAETLNIKDLSIFPNPATDIFNIKTNLKLTEATILDLSGRLILKIKNPGNQINISALQTGNYILNLKTSEGRKSLKFIKK